MNDIDVAITIGPTLAIILAGALYMLHGLLDTDIRNFRKVKREDRMARSVLKRKHYHYWKPWEITKRVQIWTNGTGSKYPTRVDLYQRRICETCGFVQVRCDEGMGHGTLEKLEVTA